MNDCRPVPLQLALPKGRMQREVFRLLEDAGLPVAAPDRDYRPRLPDPSLQAKLLKPQNIVEMLAAGSRDLGFAGRDWVEELDVELVELLDTGLDPVRLVAATPAAVLEGGRLPARPLVVASEYERLTRAWIARRGLAGTFLKSFGATEVFPPEDADLVVDLTATGATLRAHGLVVAEELMLSSTRLYASPQAMADPARRDRIEQLTLVFTAILAARQRVMVEVNVPRERLEAVVQALPAMRNPTVALLHGGAGYAVKAAVPRSSLPRLIAELKARGGTDLVVVNLQGVVP
ncbi:MAG: ATP phosphoribosyltransferase [Thermoanaerobaculia bacterium]